VYSKSGAETVLEATRYAPSCPLEALCQEHFVIPWGDFATPYYDFDQSWEFLMAEKDGFMYILEGSYDAKPQRGF